VPDISQTVLIFERLRSEILELDRVPGSRVTERALETEFNASRTPVRAALMRLEGEGLVQRNGRAWQISPIDLAEIGALSELRDAVESAGVRLAVARAADEDIAALGELLDAFQPASSTDEGMTAGTGFHVELARLSGNPFFTSSIESAMTRMARTRWLEVRTETARRQAWSEHKQILERVAERDADAAAHLISEHIRGTNLRLTSALDADRRLLRARGLTIVNG
jgi:DNA-binding GntR family transcriptional regulator